MHTVLKFLQMGGKKKNSQFYMALLLSLIYELMVKCDSGTEQVKDFMIKWRQNFDTIIDMQQREFQWGEKHYIHTRYYTKRKLVHLLLHSTQTLIIKMDCSYSKTCWEYNNQVGYFSIFSTML